MTLFGKILVFVNLFVSVLMASFALAIYTNRIDWSDQKGSADKVAGELARRQDAVKSQWNELTAVEARWKADQIAIRQPEQQRPALRQQYQALLTQLVEGSGPASEQVVVGQDKFTLRGKKGGDELEVDDVKGPDGMPLAFKPLAFYYKEFQKDNAAILEEMGKLKKATTRAKDLTEQLIGDKGLRQRLLNEQEKQARILQEMEYLDPLLINSLVEGELLTKRKASLEERVKELERVGVAAR